MESHPSNNGIPQTQSPFMRPSYIEPPTMNPRIRVLCDIVSKVPVEEIDTALSSSGISPLPEYAEEVLKLSYGYPSAAVKFFRWAASLDKHSQYSWNLMVDLLGKNGLFETMWDCIRTMKQEGVLSMATFASVFGSYCMAGKFNEAVMTFDVMDRYGLEPDVVAVNSLLSAICREECQTMKALEFFERIKVKIPPDADTFAILLEGWEKEGNATKAKNTFGEMIIRVGWSPQNMSAYDAFLTTLVSASQADEAVKFLLVMKGKNCLPGMKFFSNALDILVKQNDFSQAVPMWEVMVGSGLIPNLMMYNAMIGLLCNNDDFDSALRHLDEMVFYGAFPDSLTYNMIFLCLLKNKKVPQASRFFNEMVKNEQPPTHANCAEAIKIFFEADDPELAIEVWNVMIKNRVSPIHDSGNELLLGLCGLGRLSELRRYFDVMLDRRVKIHESTMEIMKKAYYKKGRSGEDIYRHMSRKLKER